MKSSNTREKHSPNTGKKCKCGCHGLGPYAVMTVCKHCLDRIEETKPSQQKCKHKRFALTDKCVKCNKSVFIAFDSQPPKSSEWEKDFADTFGNNKDYWEIFDFIKALLAQQRREMIVKVENIPTMPQYTEIRQDNTLPPSKPSEWIFIKKKELIKVLEILK